MPYHNTPFLGYWLQVPVWYRPRPPSRSPNLLTQGGYSQKNWIGMCSVCPKTFILFLTKICICFLLGIYDLTLNILVSDLPDN